MARGGHRYPLILYSYTLNRWWKPALWSGIFLLLLAAGLTLLPVWLPQYHSYILSDTTLLVVVGAGALAVIGAIFVALIRKTAYVRPMKTHLRLATPLFGVNISYKRIRQATCMEMQRLFPPERYKGWRRKFLTPLAGETVVVVDMTAWPISRSAMKFFLSPFFFPDRTPRLALLISGWMDFSTEMESFRGEWLEAQRRPAHTPQADLLASFSKKH